MAVVSVLALVKSNLIALGAMLVSLLGGADSRNAKLAALKKKGKITLSQNEKCSYTAVLHSSRAENSLPGDTVAAGPKIFMRVL